MQTIPRLWIAVLSLWLASCATIGTTRHQTLAQGLNAAEAVATAASDAVTVLVADGSITADRGEQVGLSADTVVLAVQYARIARDRGDAAGAQAQLLAIAEDLEHLAAFLQENQR